MGTTFLELAQRIDEALKEVQEAEAKHDQVKRQLMAAETLLFEKRNEYNKLTSLMKEMLGIKPEHSQAEDTQALKQLAMEGARLRQTR